MGKIIRQCFDKTVELVFGLILFFLIVAMAVGTVKLFHTTWALFSSDGITGQYIDLITDVLTLYVLIELSKSLVEFFYTSRLKLAFIIDAAIVFIIREILVGLFKHQLQPDALYAFSALLLVLGAIRVSSVLVYDKEKRMLR